MRRIARRGGAVDGIRYEMNAARVGRGFPVCAACFVLLGDATGKRGAAALDECRVRLGEAGLPGRCPCWRACCAASTWGVCYSALTRKSDIPFHGIANCAPAKGGVWPVLAPAGAFVRAGVWRRDAVFLLRRCMFVSRLLFAAQRQTGRLAICCVPIPARAGSPVVRSRGGVGLSGLFGSFEDCAFLCGDPDGGRGDDRSSPIRKRNAVLRWRSF